MAGERRWSDRTARPSGCVVTLIASIAGVLAACWPITEMLR